MRTTPARVIVGLLVITGCVGQGRRPPVTARPAPGKLPAAQVDSATRGIKGGEISMSFSADGKPLSLARADGQNLIRVEDPGDGFYLLTGTIKQRLANLEFKDGKLIASVKPGQMPRVTFAVSAGLKHIAFRIERLEGIPARNNSQLCFEANATRPVDVIRLDYMTPNQWWGASDRVRVVWPYLWHRSDRDPLGGFALHCPLNDEDHDDAVLRIWVEEKLPHPKIAGEWTLDRARQWVQEWQRTFPRRDQLTISATKPADLDGFVDYAKRLHVNRVYMHTDTWRGEYWPRKNETLSVNPQVFPRGEPDLKVFLDKLKANGIGAVLHTVSYGFGETGSKYVGEKPDKRLAFWGKGTLAQPAGAKDDMLYFQPDAGVEFPLLEAGGAPNGYAGFWSFNEVLVGDELVRVGSFQDTDRPVWKLTGCARGLYATQAVAHEAGTGFIGLLKAYGQNFAPSSLTDLSEQTAREYAEFFNRLGVYHHEYDGAEIHCDVPWGFDKWSQPYKDNAGKGGSGSKSSLQVAGSIAFSFTDHDVQALVGKNATMSSADDLEVTAAITQALQLQAESSTEPQNDAEGNPSGTSAANSISAAIVVGTERNEARATVEEGAALDALRSLRVLATVKYPFLTRPDEFVPTSVAELADRFKDYETAQDTIATYTDGTLGIKSGLVNTWAAATASGENVGIAGSIDVVTFTNVAEALVKSGAKLNQDPFYRPAGSVPGVTDVFAHDSNDGDQTVTVEAANAMQMLDVTGVFGFPTFE